MSETYTVVLLVEQALSAADAAQIRSLHEGLDDEVRYHVLFPAEDAAARVEAAIGALAATVKTVDGREAIILTRPHLVSEFFHRDWSSRARRAIGVPVLHLLEHETFDEQAGSGEGVTGL